eukprot:COSAG01_NODE_19479_length_1007_cov_9.629956_3_plen_155_part_00
MVAGAAAADVALTPARRAHATRHSTRSSKLGHAAIAQCVSRALVVGVAGVGSVVVAAVVAERGRTAASSSLGAEPRRHERRACALAEDDGVGGDEGSALSSIFSSAAANAAVKAERRARASGSAWQGASGHSSGGSHPWARWMAGGDRYWGGWR